MRKSVMYMVDVSLTGDGNIQECQCECAAGMGPGAHCKHVRTVLHCILDFRKTGEVQTEQTCTERLQTFHQAKRFKGSPLKSRDFNIGGGDVDNLIFDPRPVHLRNCQSYKDNFRNICLNQPDCGKMPATQMFEPASVYAICLDHDYLKETPEENFLRSINITQITDEKREKLEKDTQGQAQNPAWLHERCRRLQSSNFGRICKATEKTNFNQLASSYTVSKNIRSAAIAHGHKFEDTAVRRFCKDTGMVARECGLFVSQTHPYIGSSPDRIIDSETILEVKCPFTAKDRQISPLTVPYLKKASDDSDDLTLDRRHDYYHQIQGQLYCSGRQICYFVVYTMKDVKYIKIIRDDEFIKEMLLKLEAFFKDYFRAAVLERFLYRTYTA